MGTASLSLGHTALARARRRRHVLCDLSIAADTAIFGQTGPRVGSVDAGHGTGFLARVVGEKRAREIWYLCRQYSAHEALAMRLVNRVVPLKDLRAEVEMWCRELLDKSPTALALGKQSFNIDSEQCAGVAQLASTALGLFTRLRRRWRVATRSSRSGPSTSGSSAARRHDQGVFERPQQRHPGVATPTDAASR